MSVQGKGWEGLLENVFRVSGSKDIQCQKALEASMGANGESPMNFEATPELPSTSSKSKKCIECQLCKWYSQQPHHLGTVVSKLT